MVVFRRVRVFPYVCCCGFARVILTDICGSFSFDHLISYDGWKDCYDFFLRMYVWDSVRVEDSFHLLFGHSWCDILTIKNLDYFPVYLSKILNRTPLLIKNTLFVRP
jgi:hypothetical protein